MSASKMFPLGKMSTTKMLELAQSKRLQLHDTNTFSDRLMALVSANANAIGVPDEFILWPLLTTVASFLGTIGHVRINSEWIEPAIMWFVVAARKGEKKTAALRRIRKPVEEIQRKIIKDFEESNEKDKLSPQLIIDHFSFEELHSIMSNNSGQILGCFDEMCSFYGQLDLYKHASTMDRKTLLTLNGGGAWTRNFKSYTRSIEKTAFNVTGFIQPAFIFEMLHSGNDADGLNDHQLFDFPPERELMLDELKVPMPSDTPDLKKIFEILQKCHKTNHLYTLNGESFAIYRDANDELVQTRDENVQGILSKARGYVARIAMIVHCLEQAITIADSTPVNADTVWCTAISAGAVRAATDIIKHFNLQKFIALGFEDGCITSPPTPLCPRVARLLCMDPKSDNGLLHLSDVVQKHISEKVGTSYPTSKALELVEKAADLGFGDVVGINTPNGRTVKRFRKRPLTELSENCRKQLKTSKISDDKYELSFKKTHARNEENQS